MKRIWKYIYKKVRNYPLSSLLTTAIWVACLVPVPETPLKDVSFFDKWVHIGMYALLVLVIWHEYVHRYEKQASLKKLLLWGWLAPALMGGVIELAQAWCTGGNRSGDWLDFAADAFGATVGALIGILLVAIRASGRRDS